MNQTKNQNKNQNENSGKKVLVHCCCGICAGYPLDMLKSEELEPVAYFYNPNIYPEIEYKNRLGAMQALCLDNGVKLIEAEYNNEFYEEEMSEFRDFEEGSERCLKCFEIRLRQTCDYAKKNGFLIFTTTLSVSPHKNFENIKAIAEKLANEYNLKFLDYNFKKKDGFLKTIQKSKALNLYRQNYCGCKNSMHE